MKRFILAIQFLTIVPVRSRMDATEDDIAGSASWFPLVGLLQGALLVAADIASGFVFHPDLVAAIVLAVYVLSNGGFHLDGLADTFDALAVKSSGAPDRDRERRLAVMKDSTTGPIGIISICFALALKYLALRNLSNFTSAVYYSSLLLMPAVSKWAMVMAMQSGSAARKDGLGRVFIGRIGLRETAPATLSLLLLFCIPSVVLRRYVSEMQALFYCFLLAATYLLCRRWLSFASKKFGGLSGDTLGALAEFSEIFFLLMVIAWSRLSI